MNRKFKKVLLEFGSESTAYGVPNLIKSKQLYQKILWISFIIGSSVASFILIREDILNYLDYKVVTVIQSIYEQPSEFPTITICSLNNEFENKSPSDVIEYCYFSYDNSCSQNANNYFEAFYGYYIGKCFRFNSGKNLSNHSIPILTSKIGGEDDSFIIQIETSQNLMLWIHNKTLPPNVEYRNSHNKERVFTPFKTYTEIKIQKTIETKLGEPYNQCLDNVTTFKYNKTIINHIIKNNQTYTQEKCLELCYDVYYIETNPCNCTNATIGNVWKICWHYLEKRSDTNCTWKDKSNFYSKNIIEKCSKYCPLECVSITYDIRSSSIPISSNQNHSKISIYYASLKYTSITQEPKMQLIDLISNVGGTFGLFIGFSFVTFFELFEILIEIFLCIFNSK